MKKLTKLNESMRELGKVGAAARWATRYETLIGLSSIYGKDRQDEFMKTWPTKNLIQLLAWHKRHKNGK